MAKVLELQLQHVMSNLKQKVLNWEKIEFFSLGDVVPQAMFRRKEFGWSFFPRGDSIHIRIMSFFKRRFLVTVENFKRGLLFKTLVALV